MCVQSAVNRRDAEIQRLGIKAEKGPDANQMNLRFKNETNESIILQLNSQASDVNFPMSSFPGRSAWST